MIKFIPEKYVVECTVDMPIRWNLDDDSKYRQRCYSAAQKAMDEVKRRCDSFIDFEIDIRGKCVCTFCKYEAVNSEDYECCEESIAEHERKVQEEEIQKILEREAPNETNNIHNSS